MGRESSNILFQVSLLSKPDRPSADRWALLKVIYEWITSVVAVNFAKCCDFSMYIKVYVKSLEY